MLKSSFVFLHLAVVAISVWGIFCLTKEDESDVIEAIKPIVIDCLDDCGITEDDLKKGKPDDVDPCFKKCFLKKVGLINDEGKYDRDAVKEQVMLYTSNEEDATKIQNALDECLKDFDDELKDDEDAETKRVDIIFECIKNMHE